MLRLLKWFVLCFFLQNVAAFEEKLKFDFINISVENVVHVLQDDKNPFYVHPRLDSKSIAIYGKGTRKEIIDHVISKYGLKFTQTPTSSFIYGIGDDISSEWKIPEHDLNYSNVDAFFALTKRFNELPSNNTYSITQHEVNSNHSKNYRLLHSECRQYVCVLLWRELTQSEYISQYTNTQVERHNSLKDCYDICSVPNEKKISKESTENNWLTHGSFNKDLQGGHILNYYVAKVHFSSFLKAKDSTTASIYPKTTSILNTNYLGGLYNKGNWEAGVDYLNLIESYSVQFKFLKATFKFLAARENSFFEGEKPEPNINAITQMNDALDSLEDIKSGERRAEHDYLAGQIVEFRAKVNISIKMRNNTFSDQWLEEQIELANYYFTKARKSKPNIDHRKLFDYNWSLFNAFFINIDE